MSVIDTEEKAYLLGWIASDGHLAKNGNIAISIHKKDIIVLEKLRDIVCKDLKIKNPKLDMVSLSISSTKMNSDCCKHLSINPGKKSDTVRFPQLSESLGWAFLRGYFDGDGHVNNPSKSLDSPKCSISSNSRGMLDDIKNFSSIPCYMHKSSIEWASVNALDFLGKLYDGRSLYLDRKHELYCLWSNWVRSLTGKRQYCNKFYVNKCKKDAKPLAKARISDSGYDITCIDIKKVYGNCTLYGTGIKVRPEFGYYIMAVPRSSIIKTGYMMANSFGIIDRSYIGEIFIPLIKVDPNAPDLQLPFTLVQLIPQQIQHFEIEEVENLDDTNRSDGGFGSTNVDKKYYTSG